MAWAIEISDRAQKSLRKIDRQDADRITRYIIDIADTDDPRLRGKALTGDMAGLWRYRVGDYRIIVKIENGQLLIVVIAVGHRREVYR